MSVTLCDDQLSAADSWEIANGEPPSPEPQANVLMDQTQCPDVVLKTGQAQESCGKEYMRCSICSNGYKFLKNLGCRCNVCMNCAERMLMQSIENDDGRREEKRVCPICGMEQSVQPHKFRAQKPVFGDGALKCMTCQAQKDVEDGWWCQDCSTILCSKCAHKSHRDHVTVEFDQEYDAVRFCVSMMQSEAHDVATRFKTTTWATFEQIYKVIETAIDDELDRQNKTRRVLLTDLFGHCQGNQADESGHESVLKRFSVTQRIAKQQFPLVLHEILCMTGLNAKETIDLKTDIVAERVIDLLKSAVNQLSVDMFKTEEEKASANQHSAPPRSNSRINMYVGDCPEDVISASDSTNRHY